MRKQILIGNSRAFTLLELLVVILILGILTAFILAIVHQTRVKTQQTKCLHNLRQQGVLLHSFLATERFYPLAKNVNVEQRYSEHRRDWIRALFPEQAADIEKENGILDCPASPFPKDRFLDYGYNAWGLGGHVTKPLIGLGGKGPGLIFVGGTMQVLYPPPVAESEVTKPSEMLALGDGFRGWDGVIEDGVWALSRGPEAQEKLGSTLRSHQRHQGRANVVFCDGHVESLTLKFLFSDRSDLALRIWNRDNKPHRERLRN